MADESNWQKLAKKGYLGIRAKMAADAGDDISLWKSARKHVCTPKCPTPCPKKNKDEE